MPPRTLSTHVVAALLLATSLSAAAVTLQELTEARHALAVSEQVLERMQRQVTAAQSDPSVKPAERRHLVDYLEHVRALVEANRERLQTLELQLGRQAGAGGPATGSATVVTPVPVMTEADEVKALEAELETSLSAFDELLLEEARTAREEPADAGGLGGSGAGMAGSGEAGAAQSATAADKGLESTPEGTAAGRTAEQEPAEGPSSPGDQERTAARAPPDVGDGSDDDVVARQIRKAAESEPDPELRERLWEEYRKYKEGNRS